MELFEPLSTLISQKGVASVTMTLFLNFFDDIFFFNRVAKDIVSLVANRAEGIIFERGVVSAIQ